MQLAAPSSEILEENLARIKGSFADLVTEVTEKLERRDIDIKRFRLYIVIVFKGITIAADAVSVTDIMEAVSYHPLWDYSCCTHIEKIAKKFVGDDELDKLIRNYKSELAGFKATIKIVDYIKDCSEKQKIADSRQSLDKQRYDEHYYCKLTVKLKSHVMEKSLDYIDELWTSIADHFLLPSLSGLLDSIHEGCVEVTWLVSASSAHQIQARIQNSAEFLEKLEVIRVIMDDQILYDVDKVIL